MNFEPETWPTDEERSDAFRASHARCVSCDERGCFEAICTSNLCCGLVPLVILASGDPVHAGGCEAMELRETWPMWCRVVDESLSGAAL